MGFAEHTRPKKKTEQIELELLPNHMSRHEICFKPYRAYDIIVHATFCWFDLITEYMAVVRQAI